jgi:hypothetical protein
MRVFGASIGLLFVLGCSSFDPQIMGPNHCIADGSVVYPQGGSTGSADAMVFHCDAGWDAADARSDAKNDTLTDTSAADRDSDPPEPADASWMKD